MEKEPSAYLEEAYKLIEKVRGSPQTGPDRRDLAINLSALIMRESARNITPSEKKQQKELAKLMNDPVGKVFTTSMTDECFRSKSHQRIANQLSYLLEKFGVPKYLSFAKRAQLHIFKKLGKPFSFLSVPIATANLRNQTSDVILPGEKKALEKHILKREQEGVRLNLNHLGEAILSDQEARKITNVYLEDLKNPHINYVSVKVSTIFSQINLLDWEYSLKGIAAPLKELYRTAIKYPYRYSDQTKEAKFVNLDMEEHRELHLTVEIFKKTLEDPEFHHYSAGIVLQAYIPESYTIQKDLTKWAMKRVKEGGAPIKIRIVKGANLANEQVEASIRVWPQAPYTHKTTVDANYKRMVSYGMIKTHARAVHLGIASHNVFDISYAILLRAENQVESYINFEMLEGMADHIRRVVQKLTGDILLYCPVAKKEDFQHAIAYLIRRLDENTGPDNFLRYVFGLKPGTKTWEDQVDRFKKACDLIENLETDPRRDQNRNKKPPKKDFDAPFDNVADTDFSIPENRKWAEKIVEKYKTYKPKDIPIVLDGEEYLDNKKGIGKNPSSNKTLYHYMLAKEEHIELVLKTAKNAEKKWAKESIFKRCKLLKAASDILQERRGEFLGVMMIDAAKTFTEGDPEFSEAIDNLEYYRRQIEEMHEYEDLKWTPKGTVLVTPPWNFPVAIPVGGIVAALAAGNCVIFKPAPEAVLVGWHIVNALWDAKIPKDVLQFINCEDEPEGSLLIRDERINTVVLTGATSTAKAFLKMRPGLDLAAETGGKNAMIITALSDRDLAIKDLLHSAFGHAGQKCSATSLAILEKEVYDDAHFKTQLRNAAASMKVGAADELSTKIGPLIQKPNETLMRGLTELEKGEEWLLKPKPTKNPNIWTPGIKLHVKPGKFTQQTELFGPVLGLIRADNLSHALNIANSTQYGLTAGLHSLDDREHLKWIKGMEAGNLYINRTTTGAIMRRQPFGGCKNSGFGNGSKAGGPNYLREFLNVEQIDFPQEKYPLTASVNNLTHLIDKLSLDKQELGFWYAATSNYSHWWNQLHSMSDPTKLVGQDNFFYYLPRKGITLRIDGKDSDFKALLVIAAALSCSCPLEVSYMNSKIKQINWHDLVPMLRVINETDSEFLTRVEKGVIKRVRLVSKASDKLKKAASIKASHIVDQAPLANGRYELLHYLREVSLSIDYHRYGNLGLRETEKRKPIL